MKKKILVVLLIVFALTSVVQLAMISHPQTADAMGLPSKCCTECYWACTNDHICTRYCFTYCGATVCDHLDQNSYY